MRVLYVTGIIVVLDQITKLLVKGFSIPFLDFYHSGMPLGSSHAILGDFFRLTFIENPGMAFGIDFGGKLFLTLFSIVASGGILYYLYKIKEEPFVIRFSLAMILGGAVGNLIDRVFYGVFFGEGPLFYGKVVDFLDVDFFNIEVLGFHISRWPVFNIADASVSAGVIILLIFHRRFSGTEQPSVSLAAPGAVDAAASPSNGPVSVSDDAGRTSGTPS
ncbi:MAG: signal peptidase II [Ignavibacteriae bacterium]|nr:signal peptidase II [Ignavibacteriota bacterium]